MQVNHAEPVFNKYRREHHQFDVQVYNKLLFSWTEKVGNLCVSLKTHSDVFRCMQVRI